MTKAQAQFEEQRAQQMRVAIADLSANPNFGIFIDTLRNYREVAIDYATHESLAKNSLDVAAALGEIRTYNTIIAAFDQAKVERQGIA